jgi:phage repressor protein C with HTH and peptisase S24 domain
MALPSVDDEHAFALEISGDRMRPVYRDGDVIVVSPATPIRRGDRVVARTVDGEVMVGELKRRTAKTLELQSPDPGQADRTLATADVAWIARIVWASQ